MEAKQRNEECRNDARIYLAERFGLKFPHDVIQVGLKRKGHDYTPAEVTQALNFLVEFGVSLSPGAPEHPTVELTREPMGSTQYYGATAHGLLFYEQHDC